MTRFFSGLWHFLTAPYRMVVSILIVLVNLSARQMRAIFSLAMLGGIVALSAQNAAYTYWAREAVEAGPRLVPWFELLAEQIRFNSYLIGFFSGIMGLVVFGADYLRAKFGSYEAGFGKGREPADKSLPEDVSTGESSQ
jgi:hypothetical protein